jgi:hypothetical protein
MPTPSPVLTAALAYARAGRSILPIDPLKKSPTGGWKQHQHHRASPQQIQAWFQRPRRGLCIIAGAISGAVEAGTILGLEFLDIDEESLVPRFFEQAELQGLTDILQRLPMERTPRRGAHFGWLCDTWEGNLKLARRQDASQPDGQQPVKTLIETRGEGGLCLVAPTPPGINPDAVERGYVMVAGTWADIPRITREERTALLTLSRSFNTYVDPHDVVGHPHPQSPLQPGSDLNSRVTRAWWQTLLQKHGWTHLFTHRDIAYWQRPGKEGRGASATLGACGPYFYVFSSNAHPFESPRPYSAFGAYALLEHQGDFTQAARRLGSEGYGTPPTARHAALPPAPFPRTPPTPNGHAEAPAARPTDVPMATVEPKAVEWLWWPYLALGTLAMLDGDPGIGKSLLTLQLAANISRAFPFPDQFGKPTEPLDTPDNVVILSTEDSLAHTVKPRLLSAQADCSRVFVLTGWVDAAGHEQAFTLQHMPILTAELDRRQPRLVVIDPIQAYIGKIDIHRSNETRPLLAQLARAAEQYHCCILCIRHPAKSSQGGKAIHRGLGSIDFIGAARTALFVETHPLDAQHVLLCQTKNNLGPKGRTQIFAKTDGIFAWCGVTRLTDEQIAGGERGPEPTAFLYALCWLEHQLHSGIPQPSIEVFTQAEEHGISKKTLSRAKQSLGIVHSRGEDGYTWHLPSLPTINKPGLPGKGG